MAKKKIKKLEKRLKYCFDLLVNLSMTVAALQAKCDIKEIGVINNEPCFNYTITKD
jgi:hypothetical protein